MWRWCVVTRVVLVTLVARCARAQDDVVVVRAQLSFDEIHTLTVNSSVEYILQFVPSEAGDWVSQLQLSADRGDTARPLLVTVRRRFGATTWQLPYYSGDSLLYELSRTLCPDDAASLDTDVDDCEGSGCSGWVRGEVSLHVSTSCAGDTRLALRLQRERGWRLPFGDTVQVQAGQGAASVRSYQFTAEQESVRLVAEANDGVCATLAIQNITCPVSETLEELDRLEIVRMTVLGSGGAQLSRSRYPRGFYVITVVHETDAACVPEETTDTDWLWEAAVLGDEAPPPPAQRPHRLKTLRLTTKASLSQSQYLAAVLVTLALFGACYVTFGALVLAQRVPACRRLVAPRAVLAHKPDDMAVTELEDPQVRRRRYSTATFDSSDNSDTDDEDVEAMAATGTVPATSPVVSVAASDRVGTAPVTVGAAPHATVSNTSVDNEETANEAKGTTEVVTASNAPVNLNGATAVEPEVSMTPPLQADITGDTGNTVPEQRRVFGLPARLHVAALARRRARVLAARSDRYLSTLYTVGLFYALPVVQFVAAFQLILNVSGSLDLCYYNFLCAHPAGALSDFNHVLSNAGYLLLGALFMLQVARRRRRRAAHPRHEDYGIPAHYGLLSSLGAAMMMVALLSATYHICPNRLNFQFDTAFMYVLAVLCMVKIYQSRHPDINARAHATFGALAVLIALVVWGVLGGGPLFWSVFTVLHVFTFLLLSLRIYYLGQFRFEKRHLAEAARGLSVRPLYSARLVMLLIANAVNWAFALYGLFQQSADFAGHLLSVLLCNVLMQMAFYVTMKLLHGERPRWYTWAYLCGAAAAWAPALYWFASGSSDWASSPALSRERNHECRVLRFYDAHDLWHLLSAGALYLSFNVLLTWDDGLAAVRRDQIAVF